MANLLNFTDYKAFLAGHLKSLPNAGHGELKKISDALRIHPTRLSQILRGSVNLTYEQAFDLAKYLQLTSSETDYFLNLVQIERAGTKNLRDHLLSQAKRQQEAAKKLVNRVPREKILSREEQALFYSTWQYSAVRLATSIKSLRNVDAIAAQLKIPRDQVFAVVEFLLQTGLCVETDEGIEMGPKTTHLDQSSPLIPRLHANWRLKAMSKHEVLSTDELAYTCPVSVSQKDFAEIREQLAKTVETFLKKVVASEPAEEVACLNIDWFKV